ncbi:MAG: alpha/beta fold hydrolase [Salinibacter sp.]
MSAADPHQNQPLLDAGAPLAEASVAIILLHGRGASAQGMLALADELDLPDVAYLAPQAARRSWYPQSFLAPLEQNEPELSSALQRMSTLLDQIQDAGLEADRVVLLGFSQGACLATEYAARHPQRYGGIAALSGGLIGPEDAPLEYEGWLADTPVFLGCSDQDPYIPLERVQDTADVLDRMGARVTTRIYEGMGHTTNEDELRHLRRLLGRYVEAAPAPADEDEEDEDAPGTD